MADEEVRAPGFEIDGAMYEVPTLDSLTMDEAQVLYDYSGLAIEDFAPAHPSASDEEKKAHGDAMLAKAKNPAFKKALVHVAYARGNPDASRSKISELVGKANLIDISLALVIEEAQQNPPEETSQKQPSEPSESRPPLRSLDSGGLLKNGSDEPGGIPEATGTTESGMSSTTPVVTSVT